MPVKIWQFLFRTIIVKALTILYRESPQLQHILPLPPWKTSPTINRLPCAHIYARKQPLYRPRCGLWAVMMLLSQFSPGCQASWASRCGATTCMDEHRAGGERGGPPHGTPPLTLPPFKPEQASPCDTWGFSLQQRAKQGQNRGLSTSSRSATKSSERSLVRVRSRQPAPRPAKVRADTSLGPCRLFGCSHLFWRWESLAVRTQADHARGPSGQRTGFYFLAQT